MLSSSPRITYADMDAITVSDMPMMFTAAGARYLNPLRYSVKGTTVPNTARYPTKSSSALVLPAHRIHGGHMNIYMKAPVAIPKVRTVQGL